MKFKIQGLINFFILFQNETLIFNSIESKPIFTNKILLNKIPTNVGILKINLTKLNVKLILFQNLVHLFRTLIIIKSK